MKQAKSSELVKEYNEILEGDSEDREINRIRDRKKGGERQKMKENCSKTRKIKKNSRRPSMKKCYRCCKSPREREECSATTLLTEV